MQVTPHVINIFRSSKQEIEELIMNYNLKKYTVTTKYITTGVSVIFTLIGCYAFTFKKIPLQIYLTFPLIKEK